MNMGTFAFYSWLFNGYALAVSCNVKYSNLPESSGKYPIVQAIRYLRGKKDVFSLNGIVGTTGISKSATRTFKESHFRGKEPVIDDGPFPAESSEVSINYPAVGNMLFDKQKAISDDPILGQLNENSPAVVLIWHHLNREGKDNGGWFEPARQAYLAKGLEHKLFYREVPQGGHEYSVYILNDIMAFWDKSCK